MHDANLTNPAGQAPARKEDTMEHAGRAVATGALCVAVAAVAYFTKDGGAAFGLGALGMLFIWGNS